ncbi:hypothetical protein PV328_008575 [Microctonus aethiopoides]|uniref:DNA endonuclease activator Ctp1 C-terminal domain-containing protein n=1 Tax=Microctonus aethiopoides TaxID=144406 RepID=A0AA39FJS0_9HYME|nr:hypothetical protein PV328_008575 [Microctonus aethiopoides]
MNNSVEVNYLVKQLEMERASEVMEHSLKAIADFFKNFQADYLDLLEKNKELEKSLKELKNKTPVYCACGKNSIQTENLPTNYSKSIIINDKTNENPVDIINDEETQGIIESTQIEKSILNKPKNHNLSKKSNSKRDFFRKHTIDKHKHNTISSLIKSSDTHLNIDEKKLNLDKINTENIIPTGNKLSQRNEKVLEPVEVKTIATNIKDNEINVELDPEYLDIDATLFEQPFSQEQSADLESTQTSCESNDVTIIEGNSGNDKSPIINSSPDDVVKASPKKNILRKKMWLGQNKRKIKSTTKANLNIKSVSNADDKNKNLSTPKSSKSHFPAEEKDPKINTDTTKNETNSGIQNRKINIFSQRSTNLKKSDVLINESTVCSLSNSPNNPHAIAPKLNVQINKENNKDNIQTIKNINKKTQLINKNSDETFFAGDETYFPGYEISRDSSGMKNPEEIISNKAKRKFADFSISSNIEASKTSLHNVMELDIGDMSDWEPDVASDKLPSTVEQKNGRINSFDTVPARKVVTPKFAVKGPVVRKKTLRAKLRGWDCENCANYYEKMGLSEKELQERKDQCSRHRSNFNERYYTPPGLWDLRFPDTQNSSQE